MLLVCRADGFALNPSLDVSQYAHASWKNSEGFSEGIIRAIAQTPDGYLWLGTEFGLRRFDGVRAVPWEPPAGQHLPSSDIRSLQGARDGRLWIGTFSGLASWKDGKLTHYPELDGQVIEALLEDREGTIWVAGWAPSVGRLCRIQRGNIQCYGEDGRFGSGVTPVYEDSGGNLWAGAMNGLWRWKPGPPRLYPMPDPTQRIYALVESDDGGFLIAKHSGITKLRNGKTEAYPLPAGLQFQPQGCFGTAMGAYGSAPWWTAGCCMSTTEKTDLFTPADGLSGESVSALFEDGEGNIWVATANGLDRFREFAVPTISVQQGLSSRGVFSILAARDGSLWLGTSEGLNRWSQGPNHGLSQARPSWRARSPPGQRTHRRQRRRLEAHDSGDYRQRAAGKSAVPLSGRSRANLGRDAKRGRLFQVRPVCSRSIRTVRDRVFLHGGQCREPLDESSGGALPFAPSGSVERIPWAQLGRKEPATAVLHDAGRAVYGLAFVTVALPISRTVSSAPRTQAPKGWERE